jgi:signal transduction histidine kinase
MRTVDTTAGPIRVLDQVVTDGDGKPIAVITVLAPLDDARSTAAGVLRRAAVAGLIGITIGGAVLLLVVRRSLRPLREVSAAASGVSSSDLTARVPVPRSRDEVAELAGELNHMLERIEDGDRSRRQLLAAVSHEVRTPLTIAEGHLELLERLGPTDGEDARRVAATVRGELGRLRRLLDDILMVARGGGSVEIDREPVFLPDLFAALGQRLGVRAGADRVEVGAAPPAVVLADGSRLEQCLLNLVDNALEHNAAGTSVRVGAETSGDVVVLSVSDDGSGIDPALLPEVFEPFVTTRADRSGRPAGLGLAIVRSLIRAQGGDVTVDTGPSGTTVRLTLPAGTG